MGADIDAKTSDGQTALHKAALKGHEATTLLLVEKGADVEAKDGAGWTALHYAVQSRRKGGRAAATATNGQKKRSEPASGYLDTRTLIVIQYTTRSSDARLLTRASLGHHPGTVPPSEHISESCKRARFSEFDRSIPRVLPLECIAD
jgi:hypothetical protein